MTKPNTRSNGNFYTRKSAYLHSLVSVGQQRNEHVDEKDERHDKISGK